MKNLSQSLKRALFILFTLNLVSCASYQHPNGQSSYTSFSPRAQAMILGISQVYQQQETKQQQYRDQKGQLPMRPLNTNNNYIYVPGY